MDERELVTWLAIVIFALAFGFGIFCAIASVWMIFDVRRQNRGLPAQPWWRFSLRGLLIVTTILAVLFGILSALIREANLNPIPLLN
jgi:hypothetical protein